MFKIIIEDIKKIKMNYEIKDLSELKGKGFARLEAHVNLFEQKQNDKFNFAHVKFDFNIGSKDHDEDSGSHNDNDNDGAKLDLLYRVVFSQKENGDEISDTDLLYYLEPYARKEISDMLQELGIPGGIVPYGLWEYEVEK